MKQCKRYKNLIPLFLLNELDADTAKGLKDHLRSCEHCSSEYSDQRSIHRFLTSSPVSPPPEGYSRDVISNIRSRISGESTRKYPKWVYTGLLPAAAALVILIAWLIPGGNTDLSNENIYIDNITENVMYDLFIYSSTDTLSSISRELSSLEDEMLSFLVANQKYELSADWVEYLSDNEFESMLEQIKANEL